MIPFYKKAVFNLPDGPKNLSVLFPAIDWSQMDEYYVQLKTTADAVLVTTPVNKMGCCCNDDVVRIHFQNYVGQWDAVNFDQVAILGESTSTEFKKSLPFLFAKTDTGSERFNVRSHKTYTAATTCYGETDMPWLMELSHSVKAFIEWSGVQGQADSFIPIVPSDGKYDIRKVDNRFIYVFSMQWKLANEGVHIRN